MIPVEFPEQNLVIGKDQEEVLDLPVFAHNNYEGRVIACWHLTLRERIKLLFTGKIWHSVLTFGQPMLPQLLSVDKPEDMLQ